MEDLKWLLRKCGLLILLLLIFVIVLLARWTCPNNRPTYPTQCASAG